MRHNATEPVFTDPVCGMSLSRRTAPEELQLRGRTYYFCSEHCLKAFEDHPDRYIPRDHQPHRHRIWCA